MSGTRSKDEKFYGLHWGATFGTCRRIQCLSGEGGHLAPHFLSSDAHTWQLGCNVEA